MLKLTNLTKKYGDFTLDCTLEVKPGTVTGFIGANGAGKTTTFKALLGLVAADGGEIEIFGNRRKALTAEDRRRMGTVLAETGFSGELRIRQIARILKAMYPEFDEALFREKAKELSLPEDKQTKEFSTGGRKPLDPDQFPYLRGPGAAVRRFLHDP